MTMRLGELPLTKSSFPHLEATLQKLQVLVSAKQPPRSRSGAINRALLELIVAQPEPCFLLAAVLEFIERIDATNLLSHYTFNSFEQWLNQESGLNLQENYRIRAKIAGKWVERSSYQAFFPIGMGKTYEGPHFVTAHRSPDLDTPVASFWGWLDAFAAKVSSGLHIWNLPGGPPASQVEIDWIFRGVFGNGVFSHLPKTRTELHLTAFELMTQQGVIHKELSASMAEIDHHRDHEVVVIVDPQGLYLGDWRNIDVEEVQQTVFLLSSCLRWFENQLQLKQLGLFAKAHLTASEVEPLLVQLFDMPVAKSEPALEFSLKQRRQVEDFLRKVLGVPQGLSSTLEELGKQLAHLADAKFLSATETVQAMHKANLFDKQGALIEERPRLFSYLERVVSHLHAAIFSIRRRLERLDLALRAKIEVFGHLPTYLTTHADLDEIHSKLGAYSSLTVLESEENRLYPVGVIRTDALRKPVLGTVSLRDFCNREEMGIPTYLDVISVIDHHKSQLGTATPPFVLIGDVQSSNTLVAMQTFSINDAYSLRGQTPSGIEAQLEHVARDPKSSRLMQALLQRRRAALGQGVFYVHPERERMEYLHFLYAIFDDTDLLSKVTPLDLDVVAELLRRLKTLATGKESDVVSLDDLPRDASFAKKGAARLLQNEETYSLYRKTYAYREREVERNMLAAADGTSSHLFGDTKEQNGCCRIGQTKMFQSNLAVFEAGKTRLRRAWLQTAHAIHKQKPELDLHLQMISTIISAEEVYHGKPAAYTHLDELWIWGSENESGAEHLRFFLSHWSHASGLSQAPLSLSLLGSRAPALSALFKESFLPTPQTIEKSDFSMAVLRFPPGLLNSRKHMISPYLPSLG